MWFPWRFIFTHWSVNCIYCHGIKLSEIPVSDKKVRCIRRKHSQILQSEKNYLKTPFLANKENFCFNYYFMFSIYLLNKTYGYHILTHIFSQHIFLHFIFSKTHCFIYLRPKYLQCFVPQMKLLQTSACPVFSVPCVSIGNIFKTICNFNRYCIFVQLYTQTKGRGSISLCYVQCHVRPSQTKPNCGEYPASWQHQINTQHALHRPLGTLW